MIFISQPCLSIYESIFSRNFSISLKSNTFWIIKQLDNLAKSCGNDLYVLIHNKLLSLALITKMYAA